MIHDGTFQDICYTYDFQNSKFDCFSQEYSSLLEKYLNQFYRENLSECVENLIDETRNATKENLISLIEKQNIV